MVDIKALVPWRNNKSEVATKRTISSIRPSRSVRLPFEVKDGQVDGCRDGLLTINVLNPTNMQRSARRIAVKSA